MTDLATEEYSLSLPSETFGLISQYVLAHYLSARSAIFKHLVKCEQTVLMPPPCLIDEVDEYRATFSRVLLTCLIVLKEFSSIKDRIHDHYSCHWWFVRTFDVAEFSSGL